MGNGRFVKGIQKFLPHPQTHSPNSRLPKHGFICLERGEKVERGRRPLSLRTPDIKAPSSVVSAIGAWSLDRGEDAR